MDQFEDLNATYLYCNQCGGSMPVKEKLLLILPDGCMYEYFCTHCGSVVGDKKTKSGLKEKFF
jgi:DNA-directed RNA polymerase subunit RPC12/RpoP